MENDNENIELRSDKVRSIIGQIPPWIIRSGTSVILLIVLILLTSSYYFKYPYTVTTSIKFSKNNNSFIGLVKIPANNISIVEKGQEVEIHFENIKNLKGLFFKTTINNISNKITVAKKKGFYIAEINNIGDLNITEEINGVATIKTDEISFFERIIKPFKTLKKE